ncbi:10013_t:CDS:1, partial [Scutellospora calospora]
SSETDMATTFVAFFNKSDEQFYMNNLREQFTYVRNLCEQVMRVIM